MTSYLKMLEWNRAQANPGCMSDETALFLSRTFHDLLRRIKKEHIIKADNKYYFNS